MKQTFSNKFDLIMNFPWPFPIKSEKHLDLPPDENAKAEITLDLLIPIVAVLLISLIATVLFAKKRPLTRKIYFFYMFLSMTIHFTIEVKFYCLFFFSIFKITPLVILDII